MQSANLDELKKDSRSLELNTLSLWISKLGIFIVVGIFLIVGPLVSAKFYTLANLTTILQTVAILGIVAVGVAFVTYSGHYADLSVPSVMAFAGIITVATLHYGIAISLLLGILAGLSIGIINGFVVGVYKANPIIWTLAVEYVLNGLMRWIWGANQIYPDLHGNNGRAASSFVNLARQYVGPIPLVFILLFCAVIIGQLILSKTRFGRRLKVVGSSAEVAKFSGINVPLTIGIAFLISAFAASIGGIFLTSLVKLGVYSNGTGYDFNAVTAVVVGGVSLAGGRGNIVGVLGGTLLLGILVNVLNLIGVSQLYQTIVEGVIFIIVVGVNQKSLRKLGRDDA
ncbi:ribose transport system permease protein RbsC [Peptococcaceae bacterium CEB3]|nr:ribose transport system permease protein RbsC [Peptococcaceae bacterium CEB3]